MRQQGPVLGLGGATLEVSRVHLIPLALCHIFSDTCDLFSPMNPCLNPWVERAPLVSPCLEAERELPFG